MHTTLFIIIGIISVLAFAVGYLTQTPQPPQIIYVQVAREPGPRGVGCLPLVVGSILFFVVLHVLGVV